MNDQVRDKLRYIANGDSRLFLTCELLLCYLEYKLIITKISVDSLKEKEL